MQLNTMATDSVKHLYRKSAPATRISVGVMKLLLLTSVRLPLQKQERKTCNGQGRQTVKKKKKKRDLKIIH